VDPARIARALAIGVAGTAIGLGVAGALGTLLGIQDAAGASFAPGAVTGCRLHPDVPGTIPLQREPEIVYDCAGHVTLVAYATHRAMVGAVAKATEMMHGLGRDLTVLNTEDNWVVLRIDVEAIDPPTSPVRPAWRPDHPCARPHTSRSATAHARDPGASRRAGMRSRIR
jgi:hypothetical protein